MRYVVVILILLITFSVNPSQTHDARSNTISNPISPSETSLEISRNWTIKIVIINYDEDLIKESTLLSGFPTQRFYYVPYSHIKYNIEYEIVYAQESYAKQLREVMFDNSINGSETGTRLDEDALEYHETHLDEPQRVFYSRAGRAIDGYAVEDWLIENPAVTPPELGYTLYLVNFSDFDTQDHALEHWYDYHPIDPDTGRVQDFFRLEWDNALNPDVKFEYPAFGGRYNIFLLDPSADQWYLRWCRIWWGGPPYNEDFEHCTKDLEDKVAELDLSTNEDRIELNTYLRNYMNDPIEYLFIPQHHQQSQFVKSAMVKVLVFCMDVQDGVSVDSLRWVTSTELQRAHLHELLPFIQWNVSVEFLDIDEHPNWLMTFWNNAEVQDGTTIADGYAMFYDIYENRRPRYLDESYDLNVFGVIFIKKQMEMHAAGRTYTGLGGSGQAICWKTWERYYLEDGVTPKSGISIIQLHEAMHAIGFMHTWVPHHYVGDFCSSPMGYFSYHNGTSTFDQNWAQASYLNQMEVNITQHFTDVKNNLGLYVRQETAYAEEAFYRNIELAQSYFKKMDWISCYETLQEAQDWIKRMYYSSIDTTPPSIIDWATKPVGDNLVGFKVEANVFDETSGVENVSVHIEVNESIELVFPCKFNGLNWTYHVQPFISETDWRIWIEAWDWGMNHAQSDFILFEVERLPDTLEVTLIISVTIISALAVIVFAHRFYFRSRKSS